MHMGLNACEFCLLLGFDFAPVFNDFLAIVLVTYVLRVLICLEGCESPGFTLLSPYHKTTLPLIIFVVVSGHKIVATMSISGQLQGFVSVSRCMHNGSLSHEVWILSLYERRSQCNHKHQF